MWLKRMGLGELDLRWPIFRNNTVVVSEWNVELQVNPLIIKHT